jgi:TolB-like protein/DNA-binding winged helix-turn-helix (wHTH) protein
MAPQHSIEIRLLGQLSLLRDCRVGRLSNRKASALLAVLALRPGALLPRERLCGLLWSRSAPEQARASLRQALAQLRRDLGHGGAELIEAEGDGVRLRADGVSSDTADLESALESGSPADLERVDELYRGDLLGDFVLDEALFEDWRQIEVERLRRRTLQALGRRLADLVETQDVEPALALGERLLELDPLAEETHHALIRLDIERGALGSAMRRYQRCREALTSGLGVRPSAATEALHQRIRARPVVGGEPGGPPLVAVLPFESRSTDPDQTYLALGFAEEMIRALSRFRSLRVMAAQSSFATLDPEGAGASRMNPREVGARLGARYILAGSLANCAGLLRIGAELLDAASGHCLWSERYDAAATQVFVAQDEIARAVAAALAVRIDGEQLRAAAQKPLESLAAYDCWLRGLAQLRQGTPESLLEARPLFQRALALDPRFARAYTGLSLTHFNEWSCVAWERWDENERHAYSYAEQGTRMDDGDHITHFVLGRILLYRRDFERAKRHLARAETLNPNDADMQIQLALSDACLGDAERGIARVPLAMRLNPFHDDWYFAFAAGAFLLARRLDEAIGFALRAPLAATDMHACLACAYALQGQSQEAERHREAFLGLFRQRITPGRSPGPDEPVRWLMHVNPIRRPEDQAFLLDGFFRAGFTLPRDP